MLRAAHILMRAYAAMLMLPYVDAADTRVCLPCYADGARRLMALLPRYVYFRC